MAIVTVSPGNNIASIVAANVAGSTYRFNAGTYFNQSWSPKAGDIYEPVGAPGSAILSGGRILTGWIQAGANWSVGGQTQQGTYNAATVSIQAGHEGGELPEQLWVDGVLYERTNALSKMTAGKWFFDYAADTIYIPINPAGRTIMTSVTPQAIIGNAANVQILGLLFEHYANAHQVSAVQANGQGCIIDGCTVRYSHGTGMRVGRDGIMRNNLIHDMGQMGVSASGLNVQILNNEWHHNNTAFFGGGTFAECGGCKFVATTDAMIRGNYCHHNFGPGLWLDINNIRGIVENNRVEDNGWRGIMTEVDYNTVIRNNTVKRNGLAPLASQGPVASCGIFVASSRDVQVYGNYLEGNANGIMSHQTDRPTPTPPTGFGPHVLTNLDVHDNTVIQLTGRAAGCADFDPNQDPFTAAANNKWHNNIYQYSASTRFYWAPNADLTLAQWQALPQDVGSTFSTSPPGGTVPALNRGQWKYDASTKKLYVRCTDGLSPATKRMVIFDWRFGMEEITMVLRGGTLRGRLCRHFSFVSDPTVDVDAFRGAAVSYDGSVVLFTSNWGGSPTLGIYAALTDPRR